MKKIILLILLVSNIFADFVRDGDLIVRDNNTGLMWTDHYIETLNWTTSLAHCEDLSRNGSADWRLPNIQELLSIMGGKVSNNAYLNSFNEVFEVGSISDTYWSSTTNNNDKRSAYKISARSGTINTGIKSGENQVRCVRDI